MGQQMVAPKSDIFLTNLGKFIILSISQKILKIYKQCGSGFKDHLLATLSSVRKIYLGLQTKKLWVNK